MFFLNTESMELEIRLLASYSDFWFQMEPFFPLRQCPNGVDSSDVPLLETEEVSFYASPLWKSTSQVLADIPICELLNADLRSTSCGRVSVRRKLREKGVRNLLSRTGTYAGMTGEGSYVSTTLPEGRSMSKWEGEITLPK